MGLERGLEDVKDELQMFIESQKRKLDSEKRELKKAQAVYSPRDDPTDNDMNDPMPRDGYSKPSQRAMGVGDDYNAYERRQREIKEEQRKEYKRFAAEKEFRRTGKVDPNLIDNLSPRGNPRKGRESMPFKRSEVSTPDIIDAYAELLRKKRAEERMYREIYDDPESDAERKVRFNESDKVHTRKDDDIDDEDPFKWARDKARPGQRQQSAGDSRGEKAPEVDQKTRSKSVPPSATAGIFGGTESPDASKRRKEQYKKELELQIKEKEGQKLREKLKRMGRISSSDDLLEDKKVEKSPKNKGGDVDRDDREPPESQQRGGSKSQRRSQRRQIYDENNFDDRQFGSRNPPRGDLPFRGMPSGYDPYSQMMPGRFDMRMDPYLMQNAMYGGAPGYNGAMFGPNMPMFGPNAAMMPRMDVNGDFRRAFDAEFGGDRASRRERQQTPRTPKSPKQEDSSRQNEKAAVKPNKSPRGKAAIGGVFGDNDSVDKEAERAAKLAYQEELKQQMKEKQAAKEREKKERERYEAKIEAEIEIYNPWGKSGGGAPVKDQTGKLITDLKSMHKYNESGTIVSPRMQRNEAALSAAMSDLPKDSPVLAALSEFQNAANVALPVTTDVSDAAFNQKQTGRGAALLELKGENKNPIQKKEQTDYQTFLKQQIEEKQRKKLEEERKQKEEEAKENKRLEEQRIKMEQEFLLEQERERKKEEEVRSKNDEMRKVAAQKREEAERERKEIEEDRSRSIQRKSSEFYQQTVETRARPASPPIPTLQKKVETHNTSSTVGQHYLENNVQHINYERPKSRPIPTLGKQQNFEVKMESHETQVSNAHSRHDDRSGITQEYRQDYKVQSEETVDDNMRYLNSIRDQLFQANRDAEKGLSSTNNEKTSQERVIKQLAALRNQLSFEEQKVQTELDRNMDKYEESKKQSNTERHETEKIEIFEKARIRRGSATRRQAPKISERRQKHVENFKALTDSSSIVDFRSKYPNKPNTSSELDLQQKEFVRLQEQKLQALRQAINDTSNQLMLNIGSDRPPTGKQRPSSKQSMLESDSKFISMDGPSVRNSSRLSTAKSVRRSLDIDSFVEDINLQKPKTPGGYSVTSMTSQAIDEMAARNEARLKRLKTKTGRDLMTPNDPDDVIESYMNENTRSGRPRTNGSEKSLPAETTRQ